MAELSMTMRHGKRRIATFFFLNYAAFGTFVPYLTVFLKRKGMTDVQIGALSAVHPILTLISPPLLGFTCDALGERRRPLALTLMLSALIFPTLLLVDGFWASMAVLVAFNFFFRPSVSLGDAAAMEYVESSDGDYGKLRMWGAAGFVFSIGALNFLLRKEAGEDVPAEHLMLMFLAYSVFALIGAAAALKLPVARAPSFNRNLFRWRALRRLMSRNLAVLLLCSFVHSAVMWGYYTFFPVHLDHLGVTDNVKGVFWVIAVIPEVIFFYYSGRMSSRLGKKWLFVGGVTASAVRLSLVASTGITGTAWLAALAQLLHMLSFGASYLAIVTLVDSEVPQELRTTGQSLAFGVGNGLGGAVGTLLSGKVVSIWGIPWLFAGGAAITILVAFTASAFLRERCDIGR